MIGEPVAGADQLKVMRLPLPETTGAAGCPGAPPDTVNVAQLLVVPQSIPPTARPVIVAVPALTPFALGVLIDGRDARIAAPPGCLRRPERLERRDQARVSRRQFCRRPRRADRPRRPIAA